MTMGEARRRKLAGTYPDGQAVKETTVPLHAFSAEALIQFPVLDDHGDADWRLTAELAGHHCKLLLAFLPTSDNTTSREIQGLINGLDDLRETVRLGRTPSPPEPPYDPNAHSRERFTYPRAQHG
jgi:hypothetical protein